MRFTSFASSSSGNCYFLSEGDTHILIDAGISMRRVVKGMATFGIKPDKLAGVLITHEHGDHTAGLKMLLKYYNIRIFAPPIVARSLARIIPEALCNTKILEPGQPTVLGDLTITPFNTSHDTLQSVGFTIRGKKSQLSFATDLGLITDEVTQGMLGADFAVIESNNDVDMLVTGPYPYHLKRRILSDSGHLSNECSAQFAKHLCDNGTRQFLLAHLSRENNTPQLALDAYERALCGTAATFDVAPYDDVGCTYYF